ncbi:MAG: hypothetical protein WC715_00020 [Patescibacteria group bacterium]|jgi:hypothetical protein
MNENLKAIQPASAALESLAGWYMQGGAFYLKLQGFRYKPPCNVLNKYGRIYRIPLDRPSWSSDQVIPGEFFRLEDEFLMLISFPAGRERHSSANLIKWPDGIALHLPFDNSFQPFTFSWPESELTAAELNRQAGIFSGRLSA